MISIYQKKEWKNNILMKRRFKLDNDLVANKIFTPDMNYYSIWQSAVSDIQWWIGG